MLHAFDIYKDNTTHRVINGLRPPKGDEFSPFYTNYQHSNHVFEDSSAYYCKCLGIDEHLSVSKTLAYTLGTKNTAADRMEIAILTITQNNIESLLKRVSPTLVEAKKALHVFKCVSIRPSSINLNCLANFCRLIKGFKILGNVDTTSFLKQTFNFNIRTNSAVLNSALSVYINKFRTFYPFNYGNS